jgi:hypothetical protein
MYTCTKTHIQSIISKLFFSTDHAFTSRLCHNVFVDTEPCDALTVGGPQSSFKGSGTSYTVFCRDSPLGTEGLRERGCRSLMRSGRAGEEDGEEAVGVQDGPED